MPGRIPPKRTRHCASATEAVTTTCVAMANAKQFKRGIHLETTFPEGRMLVVIGEVAVTVGQPKCKKGGG